MGDSILHFKKSKFYESTDHLMVIWGDIPFLQIETINSIVKCHLANKNHFTLPTRIVDNPYTNVIRDNDKSIINIQETREITNIKIHKGEREIGFFIFQNKIVLKALDERLDGKISKITKEHGFLYIIKHLVQKGFKVEGLPIATSRDIISINSISDLDKLKDEK